MARRFPTSVAVVGLGYVGLPLALAFARHFRTIGFDINETRAAELRKGFDRNLEFGASQLRSTALRVTTNVRDLAEADVYIVAVPTPVDAQKRPDLGPLISAARTVGNALRLRPGGRGSHAPIVVFESTVYPGCTEEDCVPVIGRESGLRPRRDFRIAYSPERINPGDPKHGLADVVKVVAGQDAPTTKAVASLYRKVVRAGVFIAHDIRTAEAAKVIENTQRDLNIALMNELSIVFRHLGLDTFRVLEAARTKWNFLPFQPGLVGGHCIPEDPYYLTFKAQKAGYEPHVVLAGRRLNDQMGRYVADQAVSLLGARQRRRRALVLGLAFKENVADVRNTRVVDLVQRLLGRGIQVKVHDPLVSPQTFERLGMPFSGRPWDDAPYDLVVLAVPHRAYRRRGLRRLLSSLRSGGVFMDVKGAFAASPVVRSKARRFTYWTL